MFLTRITSRGLLPRRATRRLTRNPRLFFLSVPCHSYIFLARAHAAGPSASWPNLIPSGLPCSLVDLALDLCPGVFDLILLKVPRHMHRGSDEIPCVISGSGTFWLGNEQRQIYAGDLITIPKATVHAGSEPTGGQFKVISIKLPPQAPSDMQMVP